MLAALVALAFGGVAGAETEREIKPGFRDMTFGESVEKLEGAKCDESKALLKSSWQSCRRPSDRMKIGDVKLVDIQYVFLDGGLWFVSFTAQEENCGALVSVIRSVYGEPSWDKSGRLYHGSRTSFHIGYEDERTSLQCLDRKDMGSCACDIRSVELQKKFVDMKRREAAGDL